MELLQRQRMELDSMNYFGRQRLSTANSLTHYGKKGMKWKHRNKSDYRMEDPTAEHERLKAQEKEYNKNAYNYDFISKKGRKEQAHVHKTQMRMYNDMLKNGELSKEHYNRNVNWEYKYRQSRHQAK